GDIESRCIVHKGSFAEIVSLENIHQAWLEFRRGKRRKPDVQSYERNLEDNLFRLHFNLKRGIFPETWYEQFRINDPKPCLISKAPVECRLLHHAIYRVLYPLYDRTFIFDSYSCRVGKGTHKAFERITEIARKVSKNYSGPCWALKFDIRKFFDSVDHVTLFNLLSSRISDRKLLHLLDNIIGSFNMNEGKGMPLGNLTSQLFANVYLDPLDKFVKHHLKAKYYLRYADDMILLSSDPDELIGYFVEINRFSKERLKLQIHPHKTTLRKLSWGIDFVGYVALPHYTLPRRKTVKRATKRTLAKVKEGPKAVKPTLVSYVGYLCHANAIMVSKNLIDLTVAKVRKNSAWFRNQ
ncbi:MAG TPA: reverse transcriptase/maturase family protein, partial [Patescibacteria group bacterium]